MVSPPAPRGVAPARDPLAFWCCARGDASSAGEGPSSDWCVAPPAADPPQPTEVPPLEQRVPRVSRWVVPYDSSEGGSSPLLLERLSQDDEEGSDEGPSASQASLVARVQACSEEDNLEVNDLSGVSQNKFKVNLHPLTQRKMTDWNLSVTRKWLIMGDSNLAHLPVYDIVDLQIDSFPGAHFRHAQALFEKSTPIEGLIVEKIILSFGIHSRGNKSNETTEFKNAQSALRSAKKRFPSADVTIQQVNFSGALPAEERENLVVFNQQLAKHDYHIPLLPEDRFFTAEDHIRWTADTGVAFFNHWMAVLNARSP